MSVFRHLFIAAFAALALIATPAAEGDLETWYWLVDEFCPADVTCDEHVATADLVQLLSQWGDCSGSCPEDLDENGVVDVADVLIVLADWGPCD